MNRIDQLFATKKKNILNVYCTAGYPTLTSTTEVLAALQTYGADLIGNWYALQRSSCGWPGNTAK